MKLSITWSSDDIKDYAEQEMGIDLSDDEADEILETVICRHDCIVGINWDVIRTHIEQR